MKKWKVVFMLIAMVGMLVLTACSKEEEPTSGDMKEEMNGDEMMEDADMESDGKMEEKEMNDEMETGEAEGDM
ncbi:hypothetical protein ABE096_02205 [Robertmurraya massiliosenegalensis]|uniref:hypothetical protein n=1 Tax=Robertmurraya TaxID=2837507 RepID=UPI0039A729E3